MILRWEENSNGGHRAYDPDTGEEKYYVQKGSSKKTSPYKVWEKKGDTWLPPAPKGFITAGEAKSWAENLFKGRGLPEPVQL